MKEIELNCSFDSKACDFAKSQEKIEINNPLENEFSLKINNLSSKSCHFYMQASNYNLDNGLSQINLLISESEKIIYQENLNNFLQSKIDLGTLQAQRNYQYFFIFDLSHLFFSTDKIELIFDLLLDFDCYPEELKVEEYDENIQKTQIISPSLQSAGEVLANEDQNQSFIFPLLSILFVLLLFVIIKTVHGQKKKK